LSLYGIKSAGMSLTVLSNYESDNNKLFENLIHEIGRYCIERFSIKIQGVLSSAAIRLENIYLCAEEIETLEPYFYFCPERTFLKNEDIPALKQRQELPISVSHDFETALNSGTINPVQTVLSSFCELCGSLEYTSNNCTDSMQRLSHVFLEYLKTHKLENSIDARTLKAENCANIEKWRQVLENECIRIFSLLQNIIKNKHTMLISNILAYINANFTSPLISLDALAEQFNISSGWAAKLIKEETGLSFVDYLNNKRLESAERLLKNPLLKVEEVGAKSGFNSAAYFIKRFRMRYGMTPKEYRLLSSE
jgi:YesN/AraC family two-component response regulator